MTMLASVLLALLGLLSVLVLLLILSKRIVRPVAERYAKQKQFIPDAGHELKTPMTIISADADLAEMECGENQWISDIRRQAHISGNVVVGHGRDTLRCLDCLPAQWWVSSHVDPTGLHQRTSHQTISQVSKAGLGNLDIRAKQSAKYISALDIGLLGIERKTVWGKRYEQLMGADGGGFPL